MFRPIALAPIACALFAAATHAQPISTTPITVTGVLVPLGGPTACNEGETHFLACTLVFLKSSVVNLDTYAGQNVTVTGADVGVACHVIEVTSVAPASATLDWCGSPMPGCTVKFNVCPPTVGFYGLAIATPPAGFFPISPATGTLLLTPPIYIVSSGPVSGTCGSLTTTIPADPALINQTLFLQGALLNVSPVSPVALTNVLCFTIVPPFPPCAVPGC